MRAVSAVMGLECVLGECLSTQPSVKCLTTQQYSTVIKKTDPKLVGLALILPVLPLTY